MRRCDVLVVGAGPAGASAAYLLASHGIDTIVIEKTQYAFTSNAWKIDASPAYLIDEMVSKYSLPVVGFSKCCTWHAPSGDSFTMFSDVGEFYFLRGNIPDSYEEIMRMRAIESGAKFIMGVDSFHLSNEKVTIECACRQFEIKPSYIIGADGQNSKFHAMIDAKVFRVIGCYGKSGSNFTPPEHTHVYFDPDVLPGGYFYMVTDKRGMSTAGAVVNISSDKTPPPSECFEDFMRNNDDVCKSVKKSKTITFSGTGKIIKVSKVNFDNIFLIGDAGGFIDPLFGYGMSPAILSAYMCFIVIYGYLTGEYDYNYDDLTSKAFNYDSRFKLREIFESLESEDITWIINFMNRFKDKIGDIIDNTFI